MSAITRTTATSGAGSPRMTYIAMRGYYYDFFSYVVTTRNFVTTGGLKTVTGATTANCLKGAFLRETGRRIYPGVNPGVTTMMVSVFDNSTGLTGFIDPNSEGFTPQNADRAYYIDNAGENPNSSINVSLISDQGPPVYTHGDVLADGELYIGGNTSTMGAAFIQGNVSTQSNLYVGSNADIRLSTVSREMWLDGSLTAAGPVRLQASTCVGFGAMNGPNNTIWGSFRRVPVIGTNYNNATSRVFLTLTNQDTVGFRYSIEPVSYQNNGAAIAYSPSTFYVVAAVGQNSTPMSATFSYLIVNE